MISKKKKKIEMRIASLCIFVALLFSFSLATLPRDDGYESDEERELWEGKNSDKKGTKAPRALRAGQEKFTKNLGQTMAFAKMKEGDR